jgi:hypothetical protein
MSRLLIAWMTGLLCAGTSAVSAGELPAGNGTRITLVALARQAATAGLPAAAPLSLRRVWAEGRDAEVCGLAMGRNGRLLLHKGQLQLKRVHLQQGHDGRWAVTRSERFDLAPESLIDNVCGSPRASEAYMLAAIDEMNAHPPTAGIPAPAVHCEETPATPTAAGDIGPGVVSLPGRSLLHTAPDLGCRMGLHIVGGDKVMILARLPGWAQVRYTHPITGVVTVGWVRGQRVKLSAPSDTALAVQADAQTSISTSLP